MGITNWVTQYNARKMTAFLERVTACKVNTIAACKRMSDPFSSIKLCLNDKPHCLYVDDCVMNLALLFTVQKAPTKEMLCLMVQFNLWASKCKL